MKKCFQIAAILSLSSFTISQGCVEITGIGNNTGDLLTLDYLKDNDWPLDGVYSAFVLPMASQREPNVLNLRETPIQFRFLIYELLSIYNTLSMYDEVAYEFFAREYIMSRRRRCQPDVFNTEEVELFNYHRSVAMAYSICFMIPHLLPENVETATQLLDSFGMYYDICNIANCDDISTPWGLAYAVFEELADYGEFDGWNEYGNYDREYNKIPFSDFRDDDTRYTPVNTPWDISDVNRWQPLLESDGLGFLYYQEHVTSHIGYTGKSFIYTDDEFCQRSKHFQSDSDNFPNYDYDEEMELAIDRLRDLTDIQKMLVETFDAKDVLNGFRFRVVFSALGFGRDSMYFITVNLLNHLSLYESALAVWKEKVDFDAIRPPSIIHELLAGTQIESYAGTTVDGETYGTQTFDANDWEPYIRTMPHAEYPSGSSCVCKAWANAHIDLLGFDEFPVTQTLTYSALSSDYEPLSTPGSEVSQNFNSFTDVADICGQSRLWGGMHFTKSVEAGEDLCGDIGTRVADVMRKLFNGEAPDYVIDINDHALIHRDCYPDKDFYDRDSRSSSSSSSGRSSSKSSSSKRSSSKSGSSSSRSRSSSSSH